MNCIQVAGIYNVPVDDPANVSQRAYGNRDVTGPDADHGTHVAGIIGAVRQGTAGAEGLATEVRLMSVQDLTGRNDRRERV